jgi:NhaA family Na+:H+ antiporter
MTLTGTPASSPPDDPTPSSGYRFIRPLTDFLRAEAGAGALLVVAAALAIVWANSPWSDSYTDLWHTEAVVGIGDHVLVLDLRGWINDVAMVLFFFVAGLEIKREVTQGELRDPKQAALPVIAALGGMVVPAAIFTVLNGGTDAARGWGIPMATDIAIVTGIVAMLGTRVPSWLKLFLLALAIADDIGAIVVIAIFYSDGVAFEWLALAVATLLVAVLLRSRVDAVPAYLALGAVCWLALHNAHIHTTLTGVSFGLLAPVTPRLATGLVDADDLARDPSPSTAARVSRQAQYSVSVVEWLEHQLHPWSAFVVVPLFALANAGVSISVNELGSAFSQRVTWGVILGLVVGKTIGIAGATMLAVALRIGGLPAGVDTRHVIGAGALGGIGFTVSLFVTELAFGDSEHGTNARLGVLVGSVTAAVVGSLICLGGRSSTETQHALSQRDGVSSTYLPAVERQAFANDPARGAGAEMSCAIGTDAKNRRRNERLS